MGVILFMSFKRIKWNQELFLKRAVEIHGENYEYLEPFERLSQRMTMKHLVCGGTFIKTPNNHIYAKSGCPCLNIEGDSNRAHQEFLTKSRAKHGDKFLYLSRFYKTTIKVRLQCKKCKYTYEQLPNSHLNGSGCLNCNGFRRMSDEEFVAKAREVHGERYDYLEKYYSLTSKLKLRCRRCSRYFHASPANHLNGFGGCRKCYTSIPHEKRKFDV